jgi:hypothetical protein
MPDNNTPVEIGKVYQIRHSRKGKFTVKVTKADAGWIEGTIVSGEATMMSRSGNASEGETITLSRAMIVDITEGTQPENAPGG